MILAESRKLDLGRAAQDILYRTAAYEPVGENDKAYDELRKGMSTQVENQRHPDPAI